MYFNDLKCGECRFGYKDDDSSFSICLFDQITRHVDHKCVHRAYFCPSELDNDPCIPKECAGCKHIAFRIPWPSMYPCNDCCRALREDHYEREEKLNESTI